ncbi:MAG: hypothetical protein AB7K04_01430 [Pseudorhodoplanes sp.]
MTMSRRLLVHGAALLALGVTLEGAAAQNKPMRQIESAPSFDASKIPGIKPVGENYAIANPVRSDGFLRIYLLRTPYGEFAVHGDDMMRMRINEMAALAQLEKISNSDSFSKALVQAGLSPVKYAGQLVINPVKTIGDTLGGVGSLFGQVGSGLNNMGKTDENVLASAMGVTKEKRQLAASLGVDPYTDFPPLAAKLTQLSEAAAMGGLVVTGAMMAIPGAAGIVVSNLSTANKLGDMTLQDIARDYSAAQILDLNRQRLLAMGVDRALTETLLSNRNYTPVDMTAMVAALDSMSAVRGREIFVVLAAGISERGLAYFVRRHAEVLASYYARTGAFTSFVSLGGYPFNTLRSGGVTALMPVDIVSWTLGTSQALTASANDLRRGGGASGRAELLFRGRATPLAREKLKSLGWVTVENARF